MRCKIWVCALGLLLVATAVPFGYAQADRAARISAIQDSLQQSKAAFDQLPATVQAVLPARSSLANFASVVDRFAQAASQPAGTSAPADGDWGDDDESFAVRVNDPRTDLAFSPFAGYTQSTSSTARCGDQVVVGFNDSRAILETLFNGNGGVSFSGVATSDDGGHSFRDLGAVPPGASPTNFLLGQPSVACADSSTFYYAQTFTNTANGGFLSEAIAISKSTDGGYTWGDPVPVSGAPSGTDAFDGGRVAVDPSDHTRVYVSYRHLNFLGNTDCFGILSLIEVVASTDSGQTFGPPTAIDQQCFGETLIIHIGSRIAVSSQGKVYVASELYTFLPGLFAQGVLVGSFSPGSPASAPVIVDQVVQAGTDLFERAFGFGVPPFDVEYTLQGGFRNLQGFDLAVDHSRGPNDGAVYLVWDDGRDKNIPEFESAFDGTYEFSDVLFSRSVDGGQTFSPSAKVNSDVQPLAGRGFDHYQPVIATDRTGTVAVCWYDRHNDPQNFQFERACAQSINQGNTWSQFLVTGTQSTPSRGQDLLLPRDEMGQYDGLASDFLGRSHGFVDSFQWMSSGMNPDIKAHTF